MRAGWRPERRNRNIGTSASGRGQVNRMVVPDSWHSCRFFHQRLGPHDVIKTSLQGEPFTFLVEPVRDGSTYGCGPSDVLLLLSNLPAADLDGLNIVAMRQPTRKQSMLVPVWGRCVYEADFGRYQGPAIILEANDLSRPVRWSNKLWPDYQLERDRLIADGHAVTRDKRSTTFTLSEESVRNTILYRTLLHEVGHWVDWQERVLRPARLANAPSQDGLEHRYFTRPETERETFAHGYATRHATRLRAAGVIPFDPLAGPPTPGSSPD